MLKRSLVILALLPLAQPTPTRIDLTGKPAASIGEPFTSVGGLRELPGSRAIVVDRMERRVLIVDFGRGTSAPVGRQGDGPGEYRYPAPPLAAPDNVTWIYDAGSGRTQVISPEGKIISSLAPPESGLPAGLAAPRGTDNGGRVYFEGKSFDSGRFLDTVAMVRWDPKTNTVEKIGRTWSGGRVRTMRNGQVVASLAREITPFPGIDAWRVLPNGNVVVVHHDPYRIDILGANGSVTTGTPIAYTPIKVTPAEIALYRAATTPARTSAIMVNGGMGPMGPGTKFEDADFPAAMPPFIGASVLTSPDGEIWIGRSHSGADKTWAYDVFDGSGRQTGIATLKANSTVVGFGVKAVYVARKNPDDDLIYLEKYGR